MQHYSAINFRRALWNTLCRNVMGAASKLALIYLMKLLAQSGHKCGPAHKKPCTGADHPCTQSLHSMQSIKHTHHVTPRFLMYLLA